MEINHVGFNPIIYNNNIWNQGNNYHGENIKKDAKSFMLMEYLSQIVSNMALLLVMKKHFLIKYSYSRAVEEVKNTQNHILSLVI